jgi:hypothetical protein
MLIREKRLGLGECELNLDMGLSICDVYVLEGYSLTQDRELTEDECDLITRVYSDSLQYWAYNRRWSR